MKTTVSTKGQIVLPSELRERDDIRVGEEFEIERIDSGEYRLIRCIGQGGMGVVYLAEQEGLGRLVAVKVLRPDRVSSPTATARFEREARARVSTTAIARAHRERVGGRWIAGSGHANSRCAPANAGRRIPRVRRRVV